MSSESGTGESIAFLPESRDGETAPTHARNLGITITRDADARDFAKRGRAAWASSASERSGSALRRNRIAGRFLPRGIHTTGPSRPCSL